MITARRANDEERSTAMMLVASLFVFFLTAFCRFARYVLALQICLHFVQAHLLDNDVPVHNRALVARIVLDGVRHTPLVNLVVGLAVNRLADVDLFREGNILDLPLRLVVVVKTFAAPSAKREVPRLNKASEAN